MGAYWRRPEAYVDPKVRAGISTFQWLDPVLVELQLQQLAEDLKSGQWDRRHEELRTRAVLDLGYALLVSHLS